MLRVCVRRLRAPLKGSEMGRKGGDSSGEKTQEALDSISIQWSPFTPASSFLAGKIQLAYRKNKGPRKQMIPDFLVAAHASLQADRLASTDRGFLRSYFPDLVLLAPKLVEIFVLLFFAPSFQSIRSNGAKISQGCIG
ncbi:MAG TPA: hypothetical protein EYG40_02590 [Verrucomicrobia bacterium]|nr:hypothetical protein [Verrucomicrobiota bacterium]